VYKPVKDTSPVDSKSITQNSKFEDPTRLEIDNLKKENSQLKQRTTDLIQDVTQLKNTVDKLTRENGELKSRQNNIIHHEIIDELKKQIEDLKLQLWSMQQQQNKEINKPTNGHDIQRPLWLWK